MADLTKLKKHRTIPFISIDGGETWLRIGKSTIFTLSLNANVVTNDYIEDEAPTDEVTYYKPTLPQELAAYKGDPAFDAVYAMFYSRPTGTDAQVPCLIVFDGEVSTSDADWGDTGYHAWACSATLVLTDFNTVDEKITFTLNLNGTIGEGVIGIVDGEPTGLTSTMTATF